MKALRIRARLRRMLADSNTTRARLLSILLRRASDCMLPRLAKLCRAERAAHAKFLRIAAGGGAAVSS